MRVGGVVLEMYAYVCCVVWGGQVGGRRFASRCRPLQVTISKIRAKDSMLPVLEAGICSHTARILKE